MSSSEQSNLLNSLSTKIQDQWEEAGEDRRMFFRGMYHLQLGEVEEASKVFRRAARQCDEPFDLMSRMAQGRCEARRGRQGAAIRIFREVATAGDTPEKLQRMAWMQLADLGDERGDEQLQQEARDAIAELTDSP